MLTDNPTGILTLQQMQPLFLNNPTGIHFPFVQVPNYMVGQKITEHTHQKWKIFCHTTVSPVKKKGPIESCC